MTDPFGVLAVWAGRLLGLYIAYRALKYVFWGEREEKEDEE